MNPSAILVWNARGLNNKVRCNSVQDVILSAKADVVCLQETKVTKVASINRQLFFLVFGSDYYKFVALPASCMRGGILIAWKCSVLHVSSMAAMGLHAQSKPGSAGKPPNNQALRSVPKEVHKGHNSLIILVAWELWKLMNTCVFEGYCPNVQTLLYFVAEEGSLWCMAGATALQELLIRSLSPDL